MIECSRSIFVHCVLTLCLNGFRHRRYDDVPADEETATVPYLDDRNMSAARNTEDDL